MSCPCSTASGPPCCPASTDTPLLSAVPKRIHLIEIGGQVNVELEQRYFPLRDGPRRAKRSPNNLHRAVIPNDMGTGVRPLSVASLDKTPAHLTRDEARKWATTFAQSPDFICPQPVLDEALSKLDEWLQNCGDRAEPTAVGAKIQAFFGAAPANLIERQDYRKMRKQVLDSLAALLIDPKADPKVAGERTPTNCYATCISSAWSNA